MKKMIFAVMALLLIGGASAAGTPRADQGGSMQTNGSMGLWAN